MLHVRTIAYAILAFAISTGSVIAATPRMISFQGKATDGSGNPVPDGSYPAQFHLYDHPTAGTDRWSEIYPMVTTSNGLFTYLLGSGTPIPDNLFAQFDSLYLQVIFNGVILSPRTPIVSVGYALRVNTVDGASGGTITASGTLGVTVLDTGADARTAILGLVAESTADTLRAIEGFAYNNSGGGGAVGGYFWSQNAGGQVIGVQGLGVVNTGTEDAIGTYGFAHHRGNGSAIGGYFETDTVGDGSHIGLVAVGTNTSGGFFSKGGEFRANALATSIPAIGLDVRAWSANSYSYGLQCDAVAGSGAAVIYGTLSTASAAPAFTGISYGGYFENSVLNGLNAYALYGYARDHTSSGSSFGVYGLAEPNGPGSSAGGYFKSDSTGTNTSYGCRGVGFARGTAVAYGVRGEGANRGSGTVYGGYFEAFDFGTGTKYGIYARAPVSGYAGYFNGNQLVTGTKSAAVEVQPDDYRLVYSQESPECWFEDFGRGQLSNGRVHIELDPAFLKTVTIDGQHPMNVFIQLNDPNCNGTAVQCGTSGFDVIELLSGTSNASFTYRVVAKRKGYEDVRLAPMEGPNPREIAVQEERDRQADQEVERSLQQDRTKHRQESEKLAAERADMLRERADQH